MLCASCVEGFCEDTLRSSARSWGAEWGTTLFEQGGPVHWRCRARWAYAAGTMLFAIGRLFCDERRPFDVCAKVASGLLNVLEVASGPLDASPSPHP